MNILYSLIICLMVFGGAMTYIQESGWYSDVNMPTSGYGMSAEAANQTTLSLVESSQNPVGAVETLYLAGKVFVGAIMSVFTLGFMLQSFGIDYGLVTFLISPLPVVVVFAIIEFLTGRPAE